MIRSLRLRLMAGAAALAVLFMALMLPTLQSAFSIALENSIEQRLAADVATLISAARLENGRFYMPNTLPGEQLNLPDSHLLGYIYNRDGDVVWRSRGTQDENLDYLPRYDGRTEFKRWHSKNGHDYFVYDLEITLLAGQNAAYSFVTVEPVSEYRYIMAGLRDHLYLWLGAALLVLLTLLWLGLTWGLRALQGVSGELDQIETGERDALSTKHPSELLRLTDSLNRLLGSEREQRTRYRDSLDDLAHSLKTPLAVLQSVSETIARRPEDVEHARLLQSQIERMSQQIGYQLQRASLRKSGLVRHRVLLRPLLDSLCVTLDKVYRDKQVCVTLDLPQDCTVPMEQGALLELLGNILENAYRLCVSEVRITWQETASEPDAVAHEIISIEDDGPGVPPSQRARILQRGERLDTQHPGQGIGLAVVQDIIDSYGAQLLLDESALGGAAFHIRFNG